MSLKPGDSVIKNGKYRVDDEDKDVIFTVITEPKTIDGTDCIGIEGRFGDYRIWQWYDADGLTEV